MVVPYVMLLQLCEVSYVGGIYGHFSDLHNASTQVTAVDLVLGICLYHHECKISCIFGTCQRSFGLSLKVLQISHPTELKFNRTNSCIVAYFP